MAADGRMLAAWVAVQGEVEIREGQPEGLLAGHGRIEARLGTAAHGWRGVQVLAADGESPIAAVGANGTAAVAWCRSPTLGGHSLYVSIAGPGRPFGIAMPVSTRGALIGPPSELLEGEAVGSEVVVAAVRPAGATSFQAPVQLATGEGRSGTPLIASVGASTVVLWAQHEPGCRQRIYSALGAVGTASAQVLPLSGSYRSECTEGDGQLVLAGSSAGAIAGWMQNSALHITTTARGSSG
jgi:hypothetical protein